MFLKEKGEDIYAKDGDIMLNNEGLIKVCCKGGRERERVLPKSHEIEFLLLRRRG